MKSSRSRSFLDHQRELENFYEVAQTFSRAFAPGVAVLPTFGSPVEGMGVGRVIHVDLDRKSAIVAFDNGAKQNVEPWDVTIKEQR